MLYERRSIDGGEDGETLASYTSKPMYGVTIESIESIDAIVESLREVNTIRRPTTRIVFQQSQKPRDYVDAVRLIKEEANISDLMGLISDSSAMHKYKSTLEYDRRVEAYVRQLDKVDIWEIGNEVNGEWVGWNENEWDKKSVRERMQKRQLVSDQINSAFKLTKSLGRKTALTFYYNDDNAGHHCWPDKPSDGKEYEMFSWIDRYLTDPEIRSGLDYVFVSFYEDDCKILTNNVSSDTAKWIEVFTKLVNVFPKAEVGFGEFGPQCHYEDCKYKNKKKRNRLCAQCLSDQRSYIPRYYEVYNQAIRNKVPQYVGGFFYWYFWQDMVPRSKPSLEVLKQSISNN
jgi:hypothetical protein